MPYNSTHKHTHKEEQGLVFHSVPVTLVSVSDSVKEQQLPLASVVKLNQIEFGSETIIYTRA